ncbi:putative capsid protein [Cotonvirus japonicus]|uniref:Capsid protein n=1 Tax=Cotonvirus japonicus TaxID=2811091 RepID=A0ABM7NSG0_9VIRU|nr:putative capsid protein [Cotonvirus japonicus]BCS83100.1 putative capsid protein [Cotonvirus japonicus]
MAGGLIQLVAYGIQDLYLTGDPQITFFKLVYRRHTNFSIESIEQNFSSKANFGETVGCTLSRSGDLVSKIFVCVDIPSIPDFFDITTGETDNIKKFAWVNNLGYALINDVNIEIGGKQIDKQYGEWMFIWSQVSNRHDEALSKMIGNLPEIFTFTNGKPSYRLYIPLEFWFCRNSGLSLPMIALASSSIKINVKFRNADECYRIGPTHSIDIMEDIIPFRSGDYIYQTINGQTINGYVIDYDYLTKKLYYIKIHGPTNVRKNFESYMNDDFESQSTNHFSEYRIYDSINKRYCTPKPGSVESIEYTSLEQEPHIINAFLYVNYVYLDEEERNLFAKMSHEYLIEQIQFNQEIGIQNVNIKQKLTLNHPCKSHYWVVQLDSLVGPKTMNDRFNFTTSHVRYNTTNMSNNFYGESLVDRAKLMLNNRERFSERSWQFFNYLQPFEHHYRGPQLGINTYSPSLNPESIQPSSTINMTKIDDIFMDMHLKNVINYNNTCKIRSYTVNYNIFRVFLNQGSLAFDMNN